VDLVVEVDMPLITMLVAAEEVLLDILVMVVMEKMVMLDLMDLMEQAEEEVVVTPASQFVKVVVE
jgi:hypothetical protein